MTTITQLKNGKWYVMKATVIYNLVSWTPISTGYATSEQARAAQADIVFGRAQS